MKRTIIIIIIVLLAIVATVAVIKIFRNMNADYTTLNASDFDKAINEKQAIIVDVRTAEEYAGGHLQNALNIDVNRAGFLYEAEEKLPKDKAIAVYCQGGVRSRKAASLLSDNGYSVINLDGGFKEWCRAGKTTVK